MNCFASYCFQTVYQSDAGNTLLYNAIGNLTVYIDQTFSFVNGNNIVFCLTFGIVGQRKNDFHSFDKEFFAPSRVHNVTFLGFTVDFNQSNESVRSFDENPCKSILIKHRFTSLSDRDDAQSANCMWKSSTVRRCIRLLKLYRKPLCRFRYVR